MVVSREINEKTFGGLLHRLRKASLISFDDFRIALGVTKTYLNDVETDFVRPPTPKMQIAMVQVLSSKQPVAREDLRKLFDLAAAARKELPADVYFYLANNPSAVDDVRRSTDYLDYTAKFF